MSDEIALVSPKITYVGTTLWSRTMQPTRHAPTEQVLLILGQQDTVWCGILAPKTLQALAVVLQEERRLIPQDQIRHIVGQIKELLVGCGVFQPDIAI